jgi:hypothetical protein
VLHELDFTDPGLARWLHGVPPRQRVLRLTQRGAQLARELAISLPQDLWLELRGRPDPVLRMEPGLASRGRRSVAIYVHWSPRGEVSEMVRRQLATYDALGFETVFVSTAPVLPEADWQAARQHCALAVHRRNHGRDFGAWQDLLDETERRWPAAEELLLVNDSVLGPLRPLEPCLAAMRAGGEGLFSMLESRQGGPHLQSWFLLARGPAAVADLSTFLRQMRLSASKWLVVQRGELRLVRWMRSRGHRVAALFGYDALVADCVADPSLRAALVSWNPALARLDALPEPERARAWTRRLLAQPVNPAHLLWRTLAQAGCPFLKTELVRNNPGRLPDVEHWPEVVPEDAPCPAPVIAAHLRAMAPDPHRPVSGRYESSLA